MYLFQPPHTYTHAHTHVHTHLLFSLLCVCSTWAVQATGGKFAHLVIQLSCPDCLHNILHAWWGLVFYMPSCSGHIWQHRPAVTHHGLAISPQTRRTAHSLTHTHTQRPPHTYTAMSDDSLTKSSEFIGSQFWQWVAESCSRSHNNFHTSISNLSCHCPCSNRNLLVQLRLYFLCHHRIRTLAGVSTQPVSVQTFRLPP